jgi:Holliday junction resolvase RusA-like endonuclease
MELTFVIKGKVTPYVRMTRRGKWVSERAQEHLVSQAAIQWQLKEQMRGREPLPDRTPLAVRIELWVPERLHTFDLDNAIKSLLDAAQGIVYRNDLWIDELHAERSLGERHFARLAVEVKP